MVKTSVAREEQDSGRGTQRKYVPLKWNMLSASNIRFDVTASQRRPLDPSLDETVINPAWPGIRMG